MTSSTLVRLEPPYSRSGLPEHTRGQLPLLRGPRLVRTRTMSRWHRPRSGVAHPSGRARSAPYVTYTLWCGQFLNRSSGVVLAAELPDNEPLCGPCEGKAIGAGHPPIAVALEKALLFEPDSGRPPPQWCPAGRLRERDAYRLADYGQAFVCPVCGAGARLRGAGGWTNPHVKVESHLTGPALIDPCPFHRWDWLVLDAEARALCACRLPPPAPP